MDEQKRYIRYLTTQKVTCTEVRQKEWKGAKSNVATFQNADGELIDANFKLPFNEITAKQVQKLMTITGAKKFSELQGKELAITVSSYVGKDNKKRWNPTGYHDFHDLKEFQTPELGMDDGFDSFNSGTDIPF